MAKFVKGQRVKCVVADEYDDWAVNPGEIRTVWLCGDVLLTTREEDGRASYLVSRFEPVIEESSSPMQNDVRWTQDGPQVDSEAAAWEAGGPALDASLQESSKGDYADAENTWFDVPKLATKDDATKARVSLIPASAILALGRVMTFGAKKYADHNWRKGFDWSRLLDAGQRHMLAFQNGEDRDPETGELHLAHAMFNMAALIEHYELSLGHDDRWGSAA